MLWFEWILIYFEKVTKEIENRKGEKETGRGTESGLGLHPAHGTTLPHPKAVRRLSWG
jgi:hypothetical protein